MFTIKQNDLLPKLEAVLSDEDGPIDLSAVTGVSFRFHHKESGATSTAAAIIVTPAAGLVRYEWQAGDTSLVGDYWGEFVISWAGALETVPSSGYLEFTVEPILS